MRTEKQWCDNCGEELIGANYYPITHLKHGITTEAIGGSAVLCPNCYYNRKFSIFRSWHTDYHREESK